MRKKIIVIYLIVFFIIIVCCTTGFILYKKNKTIQYNKNQERYNTIKEDTKKAVEWNLKAQYPGCSISKEFKEENGLGEYYNSWFLIENGYIKKEKLLDIDNESYCDVYVKINTHFNNPKDHQRDCETYYKIYLKCNDYEDKGYIKWK